jgi:superkiller protein 3
MRDSVVKGPLLAALDDWAFLPKVDRKRQAWLMAVARAADPHPWRDRLRDPAVWADSKKLAALAAEARRQELSPQVASALGLRLAPTQGIQLLREAQARHPADFWLNFLLGSLLLHNGVKQEEQEEAVGYLRVAVALRPSTAAAHTTLGAALYNKGLLDEAIACYHKAIDIDSREAQAHNNLGLALVRQGKAEEAIACFRMALDIDPRYGNARVNLGGALEGQGKVEEAIACYKKAIEIAPRPANAFDHLGRVLAGKRQWDEAIACHKKAIALAPKSSSAHNNLGLALAGQGKVEEAIACYKKAITFDPRNDKAHTNLGNVLGEKGQLDEAIACYRTALDIDPKSAHTYGALGLALLRKGRYAEARDACVRALELLPANHPMRAQAYGQLRECRRWLQLEARLAEILRRHDQPSSAWESLGLAQMCVLKKRYSAAARFWAGAFAADARQADNLQAGHRYNAACSAALAAAGQGEDAAQLDDRERARLRKQALAWLKADLALRRRQLQSLWPAESDRARAALAHWQQDSALAGLRDAATLAKLPAEERQVCTQLWADVAALLKKAEEKPKAPR